MLKVTLLTFSGRKNYEWFYETQEEIQSVFNFISDNKAGINEEATLYGMGFSGLLVEILDASAVHFANVFGFERAFYVCDGLAPDTEQSKAIGLLLLRKFTQDPGLKEKIIRNIDTLAFAKTEVPLTEEGIDEADGSREKRSTEIHDVSENEIFDREFLVPGTDILLDVNVGLYKRNFWSSDHVRRKRNNCYAYACNYISNTVAQPGEYSGRIYKHTMYSVIDCAIADGLVPIENFDEDKNNPNYIVGLFLTEDYAKDWDYHWYRLVVSRKNNFYPVWAHKLGLSAVRKRDQKNKVIYSLEKADTGSYFQFGGYFIVNNKVTIK